MKKTTGTKKRKYGIHSRKDEIERRKYKTESLFCYGDANVKKMIWAMKTDPKFYKSADGKKLMKTLQEKYVQAHMNTEISHAPAVNYLKQS